MLEYVCTVLFNCDRRSAVADQCFFLVKILQEEAKEESDDDGLGFSLFDD